MKQATEKWINNFIKYRANHIALVQRIGKVVFDKDFSDHDFEKCACDAERLNLYALRNAMLNKEYKPIGETKKLINQLPGEHVKVSRHHPEYFDDSIKAEEWDEENPPIVHAEKMPKEDLCEMCCDWAAVAIKKNTPIFSWYNRVVACSNPRFIFTKEQKDYIISCLKEIEDKLEKEHLYYPGITYNAKQIEPISTTSKLDEGLPGDAYKIDNKGKVHPIVGEEHIDSIRCWESEIKEYQDLKKSPNFLESFKKEVSNLLKESILDIPQKEYAKGVLKDDHLTPEIRKQILTTVKKWKNQINFNFKIRKIEAKGSLLSKRYNDTTDLDVSIYTDMTNKQRDSILDIVPKGLNIEIDGEESSHPLDFFVLSKDEETPEENVDNLYDVVKDKWIKKTEEYDNEIPFDYLVRTCNFFINGCTVALTNYKNDRTTFIYYRSLDPKKQEISQEEKDKVLSDQKQKLQADLDALKIALHMISSFRKEAYNKEEGSLNLSIEISSNNPHNTINEQLQKILEKFGIKDELRRAVKECDDLLNENLQEEVSAGDFTGHVPEGKKKLVIL